MVGASTIILINPGAKQGICLNGIDAVVQLPLNLTRNYPYY